MNSTYSNLRLLKIRFFRLTTIQKTLLISLLLLVSWINYAVINGLTRNHLALQEFSEKHRCPFCLGLKLCEQFESGEISYRRLHTIIGSNWLIIADEYHDAAMVASHHNEKVAIIRPSRQKWIDFATLSCPRGYCDTDTDLSQLTSSFILAARSFTVTNLKALGSAPFTCLTERLLQRFTLKLYNQFPEDTTIRPRLMLLTRAQIASESLILDAFPSLDGWPFPVFHGTCGRVYAKEYLGATLDRFCHASFGVRASLAYQLMVVAERLTHGAEDFSLYMRHLQFSDVTVGQGGRVLLYILDKLIPVDKQQISSEKPENWDTPYVSRSRCNETSCVHNDPNLLCTRMHHDQNFHSICADIFFQNFQRRLCPQGLLHDIPDVADESWNLSFLVNECADPKQLNNRMALRFQLMKALEKMHLLDNY